MRLMVRVVSQKERGALVGGVFMICQQTAGTGASCEVQRGLRRAFQALAVLIITLWWVRLHRLSSYSWWQRSDSSCHDADCVFVFFKRLIYCKCLSLISDHLETNQSHSELPIVNAHAVTVV